MNDTKPRTPEQRFPVLNSFLVRGCIIIHETILFGDHETDSRYSVDGGNTLPDDAALLKEILAADTEELLLWDEQSVGIGHSKDRLVGFVSGAS